MESAAQAIPVSKAALWTGRVVSILVILFLIFDGVIKLMRIAPVLQAFARQGYPDSLAVPIGAVLLVCTALYAIPRASILGAMLLTGYFGGATASCLRAGDPFYFPVVFGVLVWAGLYLRNGRLRKLIPLN
jgi:hypothetical protein